MAGIIDPELALMMIRESKIIASDTETSGLNPLTDFICGHVVTDHSHSVYVPVRHEAGGNIPDVEGFERELKKAYADRARLGYRTVGHNFAFDLRFYAWAGITLGGQLEDTQGNEGLIDDTTIGYSLEDCCLRHQVTPKKGDALYRAIADRFGGIPDRKQMANFWRMPGDQYEVVDYATGDGDSTLALWESQQTILDDEELRVPWQLECDLLAYVARLHRRGIPVDMAYKPEMDAIIAKQLAEAKTAFPQGFNPRSPKDVEALYRANGYDTKDFDLTETGKFSFTEKFLETNDIGAAMLGIKRIEKARDSFVTPLFVSNNKDGRVHPQLHQSKSDEYGAMGARFSCSAPNLQAFTKRMKEIGKMVRRPLIADPGMLFEEGDAIQQEPRFFTHYSQDAALIEGYKDPEFSIHQRANDLMFASSDYDKAKRMCMGILSMMGIRALGGHLRVPFSEAKRLRNTFMDNAFPQIGDFQEQAVRIFRNRGYVKSILGRKARLEKPDLAYKAVSRIIQNSGGDHNKTCLLRAMQYEDAYPDKVQIFLPIHDSVVWQRDPGHSPKELVAVMENVANEFNLSIPIPFEVGSAPIKNGVSHWADASYGDKIKSKKGWQI
jgi:DNA polymerase I-like protein with 3'-5' exonuclease and polymerase domains